MARRRAAQRRELAGEPPLPPPRPRLCPECKGRNAERAGDPRHTWHEACGGTGWLDAEDSGDELPTDVLSEVGEFLRAWRLVEEHGPHGALVLLGEEAWDPSFVDSLTLFESHLGQETMRIESELAKAAKRRK